MIQENEIICSVRVIRAMSMKINELLQLDDLAAEYSDLFEIDGINEWGVDITFHESNRYSDFSAFEKWILKLSEESKIPATRIVAGTLVYVLDGVSQSKSTGKWKKYSNNEYWFEKSDWVHGGEADAPDLGEACSDLLVIRVAESGKDHTVFID